ncbi:MAG: hypothetical protein ACJAT7_000166 [Psychromonas sp.]|jgi:hypothetical protein
MSELERHIGVKEVNLALSNRSYTMLMTITNDYCLMKLSLFFWGAG